MNCIVLGATKGMGRALSRALAERGDTMCLLGRNHQELQKTARDLQVRADLEQEPQPGLCALDLEQLLLLIKPNGDVRRDGVG